MGRGSVALFLRFGVAVEKLQILISLHMLDTEIADIDSYFISCSLKST